MSIDERLRSGQWRDGAPPEFVTEDIPSLERRWARRRFDPTKPGGLVVPWIAMNPSGKVEGGTGRTGKRIFAWSWRWGFDACVVYNVSPFLEPNSKIAHQSLRGRDDEIVANHDYIAEQLEDADAVIVAWGDGPKASTEWAGRLIESINSRRVKPIATWCLGANQSGNPRHPSPRASVSPTKQAEEWFSTFSGDEPIKRRSTGKMSDHHGQLSPPGLPDAFNASMANKIVRQRMLSIATSTGLSFHSGVKQARLDGAPNYSSTTRLFRHEFTSTQADILVRDDVFHFDAQLKGVGQWKRHRHAFYNLRTDDPQLLERILDAVEAFAANHSP